MVDALVGTSNQVYTENMAQAFESTDSPTLDAFHRISAWSEDADVGQMLSKSWDEDPTTTLRTIWYMRSIHEVSFDAAHLISTLLTLHRQGKSDKKIFYASFGWLLKNHPRTAISNLHLLVDPVCPPPKNKKSKDAMAHGYYKDLVTILQLATVNELGLMTTPYLNRYTPKKSSDRTDEERHSIGAARHATLVKKLDSDPAFKALYIAVARIFAEQLAKDMAVLHQISTLSDESAKKDCYRKLSLAGKWAPTPGASHDRVTNISTAISLLLHHRQSEFSAKFPSTLDNINHAQAVSVSEASTLRSYYQRWILTALRSAMAIPETMMTGRRWKEIKYSRVPSTCMQNNSDLFFKHDPEGFQQYLVDVESGKTTISGATLLPHEIIAQVGMAIQDMGRDSTGKYAKLDEFKKSMADQKFRVAEAQWQTLVSRIRDSGAMENAMAVCDVSGSMGTLGGRFDKKHPEPIYSSVALSLLMASIAKPPFDLGFITFSATPEFVRLDLQRSLKDTVQAMVKADWGMNTDLNAVFVKLLLPLAKANSVKKEDMIKRLFIFSDMQFDAAGAEQAPWFPEEESKEQTDAGVQWKTNYDMIQQAYTEAGYDMPEIVYWDLSSYDTVEVLGDREGVAMMKGFSASMMKAFLGDEEDVSEEEDGFEMVPKEKKEKEKLTPIGMMQKVLGRPCFEGLVVLED